MMRVADLVRAMEQLAPPEAAESWDNVGLLVGDFDASLSRVMLTIDLTPAVLTEACQQGCEAVVSYHPPIFHPLKRLWAGEVVHDAIRTGMAIYSPHTALDAAPGGTNDTLLEAVGVGVGLSRPLRPARAAGKLKLVTFVPHDAVDRVSEAIFDQGAGVIGNYRGCSFRLRGVGTFEGDESTRPAVGQAGRAEQVEETRLEVVVEKSAVDRVVAALRRAHPYEEVAFDLYPLELPASRLGAGRVGTLETASTRAALIDRVKRVCGVGQVLVCGPLETEARVVACCVGAGRSLLDDAIASGAEVYLTGELPHHDAVRAAAAGLTVVATLHSVCERLVLKPLAARLRDSLEGLETLLSTQDREPFSIR